MGENKQGKSVKGVCMACVCPCEKHKEHNHGKEEKKEGTCKNCGASKSSCCCGC